MILVLNCGSQSIKWKVFTEDFKVAKEGRREVDDQKNFQQILEEELGKITEEITLIGHRVVHGKNLFCQPVKITPENLQQLETLNYLAPLHNPYNVLGIKACQKKFAYSTSSGQAGVDNIAVFDTEFFSPPAGGLSQVAYTYALPSEIAEKYGYRKYGFHGISHEFVARKAAGKKFEKLKIITCHLGGGASITAIKNGVAVDTSMGFTPMQGLVMMTRAGDMDFGIVLEMAKNFGLDKTNEILNKESGVKGICGENEMLKVLQIINNKKTESPESYRRAQLAFDVFVYSIKKYIGSYFAVLGGCDLLVFTGSIGAGDPMTRDAVCKDMPILKKTKILAIETDEELAIANKIINL